MALDMSHEKSEMILDMGQALKRYFGLNVGRQHVFDLFLWIK